MNKKILILGIHGFTGKHFLDYVTKKGFLEEYTFYGVDIVEKQIDPRVGFSQADLTKAGQLEKIVLNFKPDYIVNLVGNFNEDNLDQLIETNANITKNLLEIVVNNNLKPDNILIVGSAAEYGKSSTLPIQEETEPNPVSKYGLSKCIQSQYALFYQKARGVNLNIARCFNIISHDIPDRLSIGYFISQIKAAKDGDVMKVGNTTTKRDFLDIRDVVSAYWEILIHGKKNETYNVCSGKSTYISDILDHLITCSNKRISIETSSARFRKNDLNDSFGDNTKICQDTNWSQSIDIMNPENSYID